MRTILETPPIPCVVQDGVFDAFGWCPSGSLDWCHPDDWTSEGHGRVTADNPSRMIFVMKQELAFLPRELARLHVPGLGLTDEWALAPYGIDDATDGLYEHGIPPETALWLATDSLAGLFWGLHDWAHFHNHGSFVEPASTELQCDVTALAWLWANRGVIGLAAHRWERTRADVERISLARFEEAGRSVDVPRQALDAEQIRRWA